MIILAFSAIGAAFTDLIPRLGCWYAARALHSIMLHAILKAPLHFFDVTPQGRVLARFSKDTDDMDRSLPFMLSDAIYWFFEVLLRVIIFWKNKKAV